MTTKTTSAVVVPNRFPGAPQFRWAVETPDGTFILDAESWLTEGRQVQVTYDPEDQFAFLLGPATID
jgi:hypothetical protein